MFAYKSKCRWAAVVLLAMTLHVSGAGVPLRIAMLSDGDSPYFRETAGRLQNELAALMTGERDLVFLDGAAWTGDWRPETALSILRRALEDDEIDIVYCGGLLLANAAMRHAGTLSKPVISGFVEDASVVDPPVGPDGTSTIPNYTFVMVEGRPADDLDLFRTIVPFRKLTVLVDGYFVAHMPGIDRQVADYASVSGVEIALAPMGAAAPPALAAIPDDSDAVYLTPSVVMDDAQTQALVDGITARRLPSFSMRGVTDVHRGVMAAARAEDDSRIRRRLALNIQRIADGAAPESLPVHVPALQRITLNARTARQVGVDLPYRIMLTADILHPEELETGRPITMQQAFERALAEHPALGAGYAEVIKAREDRNRARGALLPQLRADLQYVQIDHNRAAASMGMQPEKLSSAGISLSQAVFNDPALTAWRAGLPAWHSSRFEYEARRLDVLQQVAQAYINLLSRRSLLVIDINNQELTQRNLDMARNRERTGVAGPEEIFRWESQLASARSAMLHSFAQLSIAQTLFNQALGMEQDDVWSPADLDELTEINPYLVPDFSDAVSDDASYETLKNFMLHQALRNAPELLALDAAIAAQAMMADQYRRRPFVPEVGVSFGYSRTLDRSSVDFGAMPFDLPEQNDDDWTVMAGASWSLFQGGAQIAEARRAAAELRRLRELRRQTQQFVTQRLYEALLSLSSSKPDLALTREAADLALKNLEVIREKYARGAVAMIELLDAQSEAFVQEQRAALAKYQFMLDIFKTQRAAGWFAEIQSPDERRALMAEFQRRLAISMEESP